MNAAAFLRRSIRLGSLNVTRRGLVTSTVWTFPKTWLSLLAYLAAAATSVLAQPVIVAPPRDQTLVLGSTATFSVTATGTPPLSYQWRAHLNTTIFTNIPGGTEATLVLTNVQPTSQRFGVEICNAEGCVTSTLARLVVLLPLVITSQPVSQQAVVGDAVNLSITVTGTPPVAYQWHWNGAPLAGRTASNVVLANVQFTNAGAYSVIVSNPVGSVTSQVATISVAPPSLLRVTSGPVATDMGNATGPAWADYDGDGFIDLFVANRAVRQNFLYRNNGNGTFARVLTNAIATENPSNIDSFGSAWGDYDNDGDPDLFVVNCCLGDTNVNDFFYRNDGGGAFTRVTTGPIVTERLDNGATAWADYDGDGNLDLLVTTSFTNALLSLYRNQGDRTFAKASVAQAGSIVSPPGGYHDAVAWCDFDNDGDPDLFAGGILTSNVLHRNIGNGVFTRVTANQAGSLVAEGGRVISAAWGDYDNDGNPDLFVGNHERRNDLYHNNGNGSFTRITDGIVVNDTPQHSYSCGWADYDNDGWLDLFVANGDPTPNTLEKNFLYHNNGDGTFAKVIGGSVPNDLDASFSSAWGDYDNDGFMDLFVGNGGWGNGFNKVSWLYHNAGNTNHWLKLRLIGSRSNRDAIGAKVRVRAILRGQAVWQLREVFSGGGFGQSDLRPNFGLGDATNAALVRVEWPSGAVTELQNVSVDRILTVTEPPHLQTIGTPVDGSFAVWLNGGVGFRYDLEHSSDLIIWTLWRRVTNTLRTITIPDPAAANAVQRFYRAVGE